MKKFMLLLVFAVVAAIGNAQSIKRADANTNKWFEFNVVPSQLTNSGGEIFWSQMRHGLSLHVLTVQYSNADYYYIQLFQDFGWKIDGSGIANGNGYSRRPNIGCMYVNPARNVALYLGTGYHLAFKIEIK
jgi:hypothetical protein